MRLRPWVLAAIVAGTSCTSLLDVDGYEYVDGAPGGASAGGDDGGGGQGGSDGGSGASGGDNGPGGSGGSSEGGGGGTGGSMLCGNGDIDAGEACDGANLNGNTNCQDLGLAGGTLGCTGCVYSGCFDHYAQDFEGLLVLPPGWTGSTSDPWEISSSDARSGSYSAVSGPIGDNESTTLSLTLTYDIDGEISFWHLQSTETCCDFLVFSIDGAETHSWADPDGWTEEIHGIPAGVHTFDWTYVKDDCCIEGADLVRIDALHALNGYLP